MREIKLFVNGEFKESNHKFDSVNPANGEVIARVSLPTKNDIDLAVDSAETAFNSSEWKAMDANKRADILEFISNKIKERKNEFIELEIADSGSSIHKAKADVHNTVTYFKVLAGQLRKIDFFVKDEASSRTGFSQNYKQYMPVGVCAQIIPWNLPLVMAAWKIGPVIASGSTTVLKTAAETPATAALLAEVIAESDLPKGVVNIITGGAEEGSYLLSNKKIKKVAFTGSTQTGRKIMEVASKSLQNVSLELGGKSANIILKDADLNIAIDGALYAFLFHSGQACTSGTRLLVDETIYPEVKTKLLERIAQVKVGLPTTAGTAYGPVVSKKQFDAIMNYIETSKKEGAKLLCGGERLTNDGMDKGYFIAPTLFEVNPDHTIYREEIFGPVLAITTFKTEEEAIKMANDSIYGLAGAVWSKDQDRAMKIASRIQAGTVWINEYHLLNPGMPFGGFNQSGIGREMGEEGIKSYLEVKHLWISDCNQREQKPWYDVLFK